ncbi:MAG: ABC transporter ATP-binding protein [Acidimicrobiia bacterium]|nr:ABC transporter ATP-binding protein [Acidimicrobiia bacterium]
MAVIEVSDLVKVYDGTTVVDEISFSVEQGEIFGIVGPNGAGKTTTVESIEGLREPDAGTIRVLGLDPLRDRAEVTRRVGAQLQESNLPDRLRVQEAMELYASFYDEPADWHDLMTRLGLDEKAGTSYGKLSGGQKQRLAVALALIGSPEIAILDELTTGLDPAARRATWKTIEDIRDSGVTVVLVTHFMEEAERLCDRIMVIDKGRSVAIDTPEGLVARTGGEQRLRFRPSGRIDDEAVAELPSVSSVARDGDHVLVSGTAASFQEVTGLLSQHGLVAEGISVGQHTLEDAYLALTSDEEAR